MIAHLIQSTLFAGVVWLTTLALRHNHARARHVLWMAASVKFLIPFAWFVSFGSHVAAPPADSVPVPEMRFTMVQTAAVDVAVPAPAAPVPARTAWHPPMLWLLWCGGSAAVTIRWFLRWRAASSVVRNAHEMAAGLPIPVRLSSSAVEPAVYGILRPVLVLPEGIEERFSAAEFQAVLAHELCHVRHRDNLAAAIHMVVEGAFWFHPLVWWMGARLVDERERACDEEVLQRGNDREAYARSILRVCEICLESPIPCVSGITGADLKERIREIMTGGMRRQLEPGKKLLLAAMGLAALAVPVGIGLAHPAKILEELQETSAPLHFDAASLKRPDDQNIIETRPHRYVGRFRWKTQFMYLLGFAYNMEWWRINTLPGTAGAIYEVEATYPGNTTRDQVRLMLQTLLIERFHMKVHRETKEAVNGYALTLAEEKPNLETAKQGDEANESGQFDDGWVYGQFPGAGMIEVKGGNATMLQLAENLQRSLNTSVIDQTNLTGRYNFTFRYTTTGTGEDDAGLMSKGMKPLGLKLEKYKGPVEFVVIDHMENLSGN